VTAHGWTISEACQEFEAAGMPVDPRRFRIIVRNLPGLQRIGEAPSGERGGRGDFLYEIDCLAHDFRVIPEEPYPPVAQVA
jgi:hypothetical protein